MIFLQKKSVICYQADSPTYDQATNPQKIYRPINDRLPTNLNLQCKIQCKISRGGFVKRAQFFRVSFRHPSLIYRLWVYNSFLGLWPYHTYSHGLPKQINEIPTLRSNGTPYCPQSSRHNQSAPWWLMATILILWWWRPSGGAFGEITASGGL